MSKGWQKKREERKLKRKKEEEQKFREHAQQVLARPSAYYDARYDSADDGDEDEVRPRELLIFPTSLSDA